MERDYQKNVEHGTEVFRVKEGRKLVIDGRVYMPGDEVPAHLAARHEAFGRVVSEHRAAKPALPESSDLE